MLQSSTVRTVLAFIGILFATLASHAQQYPCTDVDAYPVDTVTVAQPVLLTGGAILAKTTSTVGAGWDYVVMFTSSGSASISIPVQSVQFNGCNADSLDSVSTSTIFGFLSAISVRRALDSGLISAPSAGNTRVVHVYQSGCVTRSGQGDSTSFTAGTGGCCMKTYLVARPLSGAPPTITLTGSNGPNCSGSYESTCGEDDLLFSFLDRMN